MENLIQKEESNYYNLNERFKIIEQKNKFEKRNKYNNNLLNNSSYNNSSNKKNNISNYSDNNNKSPKDKIKPKIFLSKQYEEMKIENLKNDFQNGKYNEALLESGEKYLWIFLTRMVQS